MKQYFKQSIRHWWMFAITLFLAFIFESAKTTDFVILSLIIGILIELYQYINFAKVKNKVIDNQYIKFALFDIFITVIAGALGSLFFNFLNFIYNFITQ